MASNPFGGKYQTKNIEVSNSYRRINEEKNNSTHVAGNRDDRQRMGPTRKTGH